MITVAMQKRTGSVLLLVLVVIAMMALGTGSYLVLMHNQHVATRYGGSKQQARLFAESGIEFLKVFLDQSESSIAAQGGTFENITWMQGQLVADDPAGDFRGRFSILSPGQSMGYFDSYRFGLEDESSKLNLNALVGDSSPLSSTGRSGSTSGNSGGSSDSGSSSNNSSSQGGGDLNDEEQARYRLMALPGMTEDVADAILDWIDTDDRPREFGAEETYYTGLTPAYEPRNGPLNSLDELLQVRGVTPELLYGIDSNRNFTVEVNENPRGAAAMVDNFNGQMNRGWAAYLTLFSMELQETPTGEKRLDLNASDLEELYDDLSTLVGTDEAKFVILCRQYSPADENAQGQTVRVSSMNLDFKKKASNQISSILDLVGVRLSVQENEQQPLQLVESPWQDTSDVGRSLMELMDYARTENDIRIKGRININQASGTVLMSIPAMTEAMADQIISRRMPSVDPSTGEQRHAIWIWSEGIVTLEEMKQLLPYVTSGGDVYSGQIVGFFEGAPMQSRLRVVLDRTGGTVGLLEWEDLGILGPGFEQGPLMGLSPELKPQPEVAQ